MGYIRVSDMITVVAESLDHPFSVGDVVRVVKLLDFGCVWVKRSDGTEGCLIPCEFAIVA